jgi:hypothetical protein
LNHFSTDSLQRFEDAQVEPSPPAPPDKFLPRRQRHTGISTALFIMLLSFINRPKPNHLLRLFRQCLSTKSSTIEEKAAQQLLKDTELAYIVPLYIEDDGGHDRKIAKWFKQEGDAVTSQDVLCEIDTTEFSYDFTTDEEGFLAQRVAVEEGGAVEDEDLLALLVPTEENLVDYRQRFKDMCQLLEAEQKEANIATSLAAQGTETVAEIVERILTVTGMPQYKEVFRVLVVDEGFDTPGALQEITKEDLKECGVTKKGHQRALIRALQPQAVISD